MTPQQLEKAARKLCELKGLIPDALRHWWDQTGHRERKQWELESENILAHWQLQEAIKHGLSND